MNRIRHHIILGELENGKKVKITVDGKEIEALEGEMIAADRKSVV